MLSHQLLYLVVTAPHLFSSLHLDTSDTLPASPCLSLTLPPPPQSVVHTIRARINSDAFRRHHGCATFQQVWHLFLRSAAADPPLDRSLLSELACDLEPGSSDPHAGGHKSLSPTSGAASPTTERGAPGRMRVSMLSRVDASRLPPPMANGRSSVPCLPSSSSAAQLLPHATPHLPHLRKSEQPKPEHAANGNSHAHACAHSSTQRSFEAHAERLRKRRLHAEAAEAAEAERQAQTAQRHAVATNNIAPQRRMDESTLRHALTVAFPQSEPLDDEEFGLLYRSLEDVTKRGYVTYTTFTSVFAPRRCERPDGGPSLHSYQGIHSWEPIPGGFISPSERDWTAYDARCVRRDDVSLQASGGSEDRSFHTLPLRFLFLSRECCLSRGSWLSVCL